MYTGPSYDDIKDRQPHRVNPMMDSKRSEMWMQQQDINDMNPMMDSKRSTEMLMRQQDKTDVNDNRSRSRSKGRSSSSSSMVDEDSMNAITEAPADDE